MPPPHFPLRAPQGGVPVSNVDATIREVDKSATQVFGQAILDKVSHAHVDGLISSTGDLNSLYTIIVQRGVDIAPLENKVEGLINQACNIN